MEPRNLHSGGQWIIRAGGESRRSADGWKAAVLGARPGEKCVVKNCPKKNRALPISQYCPWKGRISNQVP
ncbi:hypothetical protein KA005_21785, partial [bacterium]|nr:hypothetical protein [bacterium]